MSGGRLVTDFTPDNLDGLFSDEPPQNDRDVSFVNRAGEPRNLPYSDGGDSRSSGYLLDALCPQELIDELVVRGVPVLCNQAAVDRPNP